MARSINYSDERYNAEGGYPVQLIKIQPDSNDKNSLRLNTSEKTAEYGSGVLWYPSAGVLEMTSVEETKDVKTNQVTIVLNGLPEVALSVLKTYNGIGGIVEIYQGWMLDKEEENITRYRFANVENVYLKWKGVIYSHSVDQENQKFGKVKITLECKNILGTIIGGRHGRFTSDSSFKHTTNGDRSMEFVASMTTFNPKFGQD
jgi:hypothetical protein|tara:strand:+ start:2565 stop:3173 length:609 start_codon:yes stop_codon:yes gene_type:complete